MNLTIDIGNSSAKAALFEGGRIVAVFRSEKSIRDRLAGIESAIVTSTRGPEEDLEQVVRRNVKKYLKLTHATPVPVKNLYATPETLGCDRLAAAAGAQAMFPGEAALIVDFGTAITYDLVTAAGEFLGGNISPGARSRLRALHDYTGALPLCELPGAKTGGDPRKPQPPHFPSRDTKSAIGNGVAAGIIAETESYIELAKKKFGEIRIIFTGGDADYFAERVKNPIFATSDIVFYGLNSILEYNANS